MYFGGRSRYWMESGKYQRQRYKYFFVFFFSSRRRHTRCREVSWARRCVQETGEKQRGEGKRIKKHGKRKTMSRTIRQVKEEREERVQRMRNKRREGEEVTRVLKHRRKEKGKQLSLIHI
eukprot:TRINITY_DN48807_c0_g1_i1.p5 TRINITY_DN48807_c0_g1~~TRINITY_DN48807_c0_g1_i1.p5  ORF type:complete len:120 (-),score=46.02 TRINITY_DN48807_c0_g1_i1:189-548(-)